MIQHIIKPLGAAILLASAMTSCKDLDGNYDELVPDNYYSIVSLKETGIQELEFSVADEAFIYDLPVLKGGLHIDETVDVFVDVLSQDWINENYNLVQGTNYKVIPASNYVVSDYHLKIMPGKSGKSVQIVFNAPRLYSTIQESGDGNEDFVLPIAISAATKEINQEKSTVLLRCRVTPVTLSFDTNKSEVKMPDSDTYTTADLVVLKTGAMATDVHFEVMSQAHIDEHYNIPEGTDYKILPPDTYEFESDVEIPAEMSLFYHPVKFDVEKIREIAGSETLVLPIIMTSSSSSAVVQRSEIIMQCFFHEYTYAELQSKSGWSVVYGSVAMPYGAYSSMFDGETNTEGWMSHIVDGFPGSQNIGDPYVVMDLGGKSMIGECGVLIGVNGWSDVNPMSVEFYVTDDENLNPDLSKSDLDMLNFRSGAGDPDLLSDNYLNLHNRLIEYDKGVNWVKVGAITGFSSDASCQGIFNVTVPANVLNRHILSRYVKIVVRPFPYGMGSANRTKICELYFSRIASIDGLDL